MPCDNSSVLCMNLLFAFASSWLPIYKFGILVRVEDRAERLLVEDRGERAGMCEDRAGRLFVEDRGERAGMYHLRCRWRMAFQGVYRLQSGSRMASQTGMTVLARCYTIQCCTLYYRAVHACTVHAVFCGNALQDS